MMKKKRMIASLLVFVVSGTILLGADIPFAERDPDKFPSQSLVNFALREVHDGFIHPKQGRDNWTLFIPLLERVAKYRGSVGKEDVASVEARIVSWFTLYAFACEYDSDPVKAEFGGRLDCLRRIGEFDLIRSDTNTLFQVSDWLAEAVALAVDDDTQCRELTEAKRKDSIILYGGRNPYGRKWGLHFAGTVSKTWAWHWEPEFRACKAKFRFRREYNRRLPVFRKEALECFYRAIIGGYKDRTDIERKAIWDEFCRRAKATAEEKSVAEALVRNVLSSLKMKITNCIVGLPNDGSGTPEQMMESGLPANLIASERLLGAFVSNNIEVVYSNFSVAATNLAERRILLASAWWLGDDYYLDCLSRNVDLAISGVISRDDLKWYMTGDRSRDWSYILADQYDRPGVSNIVLRLMAYTGETNKYEKVLNGKAKAEYIEREEFIVNVPD